MEDLLRDLRARRPETIYARKRVSREGVIMWAEREVAERLLFFLRTEHVKEAEEVYLPLYLVRCNVSAGRGKYRDARILASGLTGLPVALRKGAFVEVGEALANVPDDVLELYKKYAGEQVSRAYFVKRHGEAAWNKLVRYLTQAGLATKISERPAVIELKDVLPSLDKLEEAGATIERGEPREGRRLDHLYTPGSVVLLLERLLDAKVKAIFPLYAPAYLVKLVDRSGNYRIVAVAAWTESPRLYVSNYFTTGSL
ncbi:MAG: hypothetical protein N3F67_03230 [Acidilobaceae archaeon]|nr:hypothetical protein [Acidilobaceae archaeon]